MTSSYEYGITGMREKATRTTPASTTWTKSAWDGRTFLAEEDSGGTRYRYLLGPGGIPLALEVTPFGGAAALYSYHTDSQGSVVALTCASGTLAASYAYDPFGRPTPTGGSDPSLANRQPLRLGGGSQTLDLTTIQLVRVSMGGRGGMWSLITCKRTRLIRGRWLVTCTDQAGWVEALRACGVPLRVIFG